MKAKIRELLETRRSGISIGPVQEKSPVEKVASQEDAKLSTKAELLQLLAETEGRYKLPPIDGPDEGRIIPTRIRKVAPPRQFSPGERVGTWTIVERLPNTKNGRRRYSAICGSCGQVRTVGAGVLVNALLRAACCILCMRERKSWFYAKSRAEDEALKELRTQLRRQARTIIPGLPVGTKKSGKG